MNDNPTKAQLQSLLSAADDDAGHHVLWVDTGGKVSLTLLDDSEAASQFDTTHPNSRIRFGAFCVGNDYVGKDADADPEHVRQYYNSLIREWKAAEHAPPGEILTS